MAYLRVLLLAGCCALAPAYADEAKPNRIERTAKKTGDAVEKAAKRTVKAIDRTIEKPAKAIEKTAKRTGKAIDRAANKSEDWVKRKLD